jgi:transglutaminase superfamily protein
LKRLLKRIQTLRQLHPREQLILVQAWLLLLAMDLCLRLLPFRSVLASVNLFRARTEADERRLSPPLPRLIWLVESAGRYVPVSATCLKQALVLSCLLGRRGVSTTIQIGVKTRDGTFIAHAWLERQGRVIFGLSGKEQYNQLSPSMSPLIGN